MLEGHRQLLMCGQSPFDFAGGDFNNDHTTNFADFVLLSNNFGQTLTGNNITITPDDLAALQSFAAAVSSSVPEPATLSLLIPAALLLIGRKRKT